MKEITSIEQYQEIISHENAIILFTANWCPDCIVIKPFMPSIVEKYSNYHFYLVEISKDATKRTRLTDLFQARWSLRYSIR